MIKLILVAWIHEALITTDIGSFDTMDRCRKAAEESTVVSKGKITPPGYQYICVQSK